MALFKSNPEKTMQRDIDAAKANRDRLSSKLAETETAIVERRAAAQALARDGADDAALEKAELAIRGAQDRATSYSGALADVLQKLGALEQTKIENADRKLRSETAAEVATMATGLENATKKFDVAVAELAEIAGHATRFCPDAVGLEAFASSSRVQVPPATELVVTVMRNYAAAVLRGEGPAMLPKPESVMPAPPAPVLTRVWTTRPIAFLQDGMIVTRDLNEQVDVSPSLARKAIELEAAVPLGDPKFGVRMASLRQWNGGGTPSLERCTALDEQAAVAVAKKNPLPESQKIRHSAHTSFEPMPGLGEPYIVKTQPGNAIPSEAA